MITAFAFADLFSLRLWSDRVATCPLSFCLFDQVLDVAVVIEQSRAPLSGVIDFHRRIIDDLLELSLRSFFAEPQ
jgi:hypothetical protein